VTAAAMSGICIRRQRESSGGRVSYSGLTGSVAGGALGFPLDITGYCSRVAQLADKPMEDGRPRPSGMVRASRAGRSFVI